MAYYRNVSINFWTDVKIDDTFTPEDKYFYLYLITNPHTNLCGCYEISLKQMERETGYNEDTVLRLLKRMEQEHKVIRYDGQTKEILMINWSKYNWSKSEKLKSAVLKQVSKIKSKDFQKIIIEILENRLTPSQIQNTVSDTDITVTVSDTVSVSDTDTDVSIGYGYPIDTVSKTKKKSIPPTLEEVKAYCSERNNGVDAQRFIDFYTSKGWMIGKNPMKDWKAAVRTWEKNSKKEEKSKETSYDLDEWEKLASNLFEG